MNANDATLTHLDAAGSPTMVDVGDKPTSARLATAAARIVMKPETLKALRGKDLGKGDALLTARLAGIMAAKRTADLIPLCHPLAISHCSVDFAFDDAASAIEIRSSVRTEGRTGVEMEALTAAAAAALTIYDMAKAVDRGMIVDGLRLLKKEGGKTGSWSASEGSGA